MAVDLWSEVTVERADKFEIVAEGDGADKMPKDKSNYLVLGCQKAFEAANKEMPTLKYSVKSNIPYARGLGSSSAAIVAGIIAGLVLAGHRLPCWGSEALLQIAAGIEVRAACIRSTGCEICVCLYSVLVVGSTVLFMVSLRRFSISIPGSPRQCVSRHLWRHPDWNSQRHTMGNGTRTLPTGPAIGHVHSRFHW